MRKGEGGAVFLYEVCLFLLVDQLRPDSIGLRLTELASGTLREPPKSPNFQGCETVDLATL